MLVLVACCISCQFFTTHSPNVRQRCADRLLLLNDRLYTHGSARDELKQIQNPLQHMLEAALRDPLPVCFDLMHALKKRFCSFNNKMSNSAV